MSKQSTNLNESFANQFRSFLDTISGTGISSAQNLQRILIIFNLLSELSGKSEEWETKRRNNKECTTESLESLLVAVELSEMLLLANSKELKSQKLQNKVNGVIGNLKNIARTANDLEIARIKEIEQVTKNVFSESDDFYRQMNSPEFRYDSTQQGTGRNAYRDSKNYTKSGTLFIKKNID
jgi:hypothetical protein